MLAAGHAPASRHAVCSMAVPCPFTDGVLRAVAATTQGGFLKGLALELTVAEAIRPTAVVVRDLVLSAPLQTPAASTQLWLEASENGAARNRVRFVTRG